ncbi:hypothetical protein LY56_03259 [Roseinatronobacter thiooxidans]|uniref:Uncharacterized protein n=1 Tax=Roseinatronobacter thiooxidans TaxID=121821 RepID=A0A2W7QEJ8_9RHOB|nr:hypothetical protein LY56_03259 [Roseinatronobacter thiooxidans]
MYVTGKPKRLKARFPKPLLCATPVWCDALFFGAEPATGIVKAKRGAHMNHAAAGMSRRGCRVRVRMNSMTAIFSAFQTIPFRNAS